MHNNNLSKENIAYIGDDLNDLHAMSLANFIGCPSDACTEIKLIASYISPFSGGNGAVRDIIMYLLTQRNEWNYAIKQIYTGDYDQNIQEKILENRNG